ncbi:uncharacterized protein LOC120085919 isoform X2 [Benincasa hispida]|uniref:uncharacterized protein LOC120085919 isoform X2 n=1 Tax=Benincasa hispida TaxID=102211 RepID=UPI00190157BB|nr:uncharacterized protein LOC120085919 isoform X2 [Benincasa hispida]
MEEHQKRSHGHGTEADGSNHELVLIAFDRNGAAKNSSKVGPTSRVRACEVENISRRLSILEEDTRAMKKALFNNLEESRNLVYEINQQFQNINRSHTFCNEVAAALMASLEDHDETLHLPKEWRSGVGLSEIFHHQTNISLVFKHFKANLLALTDSAKSLHLMKEK